MRFSTSSRKVESAPCLVREPVSSLSKTARTGTLCEFFAERKPSRHPYTHCKSSRCGAEMYSPLPPHTLPLSRTYRNRSCESISDSDTPAASAIILINEPFASSTEPRTGSMSTCAFHVWPLLASRFM